MRLETLSRASVSEVTCLKKSTPFREAVLESPSAAKLKLVTYLKRSDVAAKAFLSNVMVSSQNSSSIQLFMIPIGEPE